MIKIENLSFGYGPENLFSDITLTFSEGKYTAIIGPNGAGKSTLLKLLNGLLVPNRGIIKVLGRNIETYDEKELARSIAYVPQQTKSNFSYRARDIVAMGRHPYSGIFQTQTEEDRDSVDRALDSVDATHLGHRLYSELSGGEQQRIILASALAQDPRVLLLDEPSAFMDIYHQLKLHGIMEDLSKDRGITIIAVTHHLNLALGYADHIVVMNEGEIVTEKSPDDLVKSKIFETVFKVKGEFYFLDYRQKWHFIANGIFEKK